MQRTADDFASSIRAIIDLDIAMNDINTATKRTTINGTILTALIIAAANAFGWEIELDDLTPFLPVLAGAILVFYRLSLVLSAKWPNVGYVLFGSKKEPTYSPPPAPPALGD